jgi:hypothetical protein
VNTSNYLLGSWGKAAMYGISVVHGLQIISTKSSNTIVLAKQNTHMMFTVAENAALNLHSVGRTQW